MSTKITIATLTNFQKVSYARIEPSGNLIVLAGKNGAGKTGTIDGLETTFTGHNGRNIKRPIKDGHGKASIDIALSDGSTLTRGYTPSGTTLKGKDAAGNKFGQKEIDARLSSLGIDGRKFISMGEKDQLKALLSIVDLPFVPAELDAERKALEAKRLLVGQQGKAIGEVAADPSLPTEEVSLNELLGRHRAAQESITRRSNKTREAQHWKSEAERLRQELSEAERKAVEAEEDLNELPLGEDPVWLQEQIDGAETSNAAIRANAHATTQAALKVALREQYEALTEEIKAIDRRKADGLAQAEMPIEGLDFDDEGVLYQKVPFSRASGREQLIVSCAMIMATNPEIRVIVVRDGNVLDLEGLQILQDMAEATDFQVFIEIVREEKNDEEYFFADGELI